jgi:hypothetical protein
MAAGNEAIPLGFNAGAAHRLSVKKERNDA